jgi:hypothetical protein
MRGERISGIGERRCLLRQGLRDGEVASTRGDLRANRPPKHLRSDVVWSSHPLAELSETVGFVIALLEIDDVSKDSCQGREPAGLTHLLEHR